MKQHNMERIKLLNNHGVCHIPTTHTPTGYLLDLANLTDTKIDLIVAPGALIDLLIFNGNQDQTLAIECADDVQGKVQIVMNQPNKNLTLNMALQTNVQLEAALADFTRGKGKVIVSVELLGKDSHLEWHTAALASDKDRKFYAVNFTHKQLNTYANMTNYGVTEGESSLQFTGTGHIINGAKYSKTHQAAKIMVFDPRCFGRADPVLKIDENEVEASHAATVGKVNDEHLFYLCSRGLTKQEAKRLITLGYLNPIIQYFTDENIKDSLAQQIELGSRL
jgi:Fe-S cluster assembly scaffold protein SufB